MPLISLTPDQRALLHQLADAPDEAAAQDLLAVPGPVQEVLAERVGWMHGQVVQAHTARRARIVAQNKKETRHAVQ
jgi:hypothetical protein